MKLFIKSLVAASFCLPVAFAACKDGCECKKCDSAEKSEQAGCKEGCDCKTCKEKAEDKDKELLACDSCDKHKEKKKDEDTVA